ncbi:uncharacterized protein LOC110983017 [Acanthaster planci]|uniref:Uncharacterized protein LOC110983017 n=1 Tax=Acanthaster planci TaxID=133434 RepID=A0A8B7YW68_ACAPL|nr:uncharacterized protein LOC110983017 [Acanthaster planci]
MAKLSGRHGMLVFTGGMDVAFGVVFILLGSDSVRIFSHGAVGVPMWAGIGIILVGIGNFVTVLTSGKKKRTEYVNINFGSLVLNLLGMTLAACLIGFYTWGTWDVLQMGSSDTLIPNSTISYSDAISIYATVLLMAIFVFLLSMMVMFMDCCSSVMFGDAPGSRDYGLPPPRSRSMYDGPYGMPPSHMYKP